MDNRYVYLMIRTRDNKAQILTCRKMFDAKSVEKKLHSTFGASRFIMTKKIRYRKWFQSHVKIGIAKNPVNRKNQVSRNIFKSGRTEWFSINPMELLLLQAYIFWYAYRFYFRLFVFCFIIIYLLIKY